MSTTKSGTAIGVYERCATDRDPYLRRGRDNSALTIPALLPPDGSNGHTKLRETWQSVCAYCVNSLANRLLLTLLPPTRKFFRHAPTPELEKELEESQAQGSNLTKSSIETALSKVENIIRDFLESIGVRQATYEALRLLIVSGNALMLVDRPRIRVYSLDQYVVRRTPEGDLLEIVVREMVDTSELDEVTRKALQVNNPTNSTPPAQVPLFTHVFKKDDQWVVEQSADTVMIPSRGAKYGERKLPWIPLRWTRIDGENYGRSHCDDYRGDMAAIESLSRSIIRFAAAAAKVIFLVNPNGVTDVNRLSEAEEGEFVPGKDEDVTVKTLEKFADFQIAESVLGKLITQLRYSFLTNSAIQRQGERVTAEEIRYMAQELENTLGGVYSLLSVEFQLPLVEIAQSKLQLSGEIPKLNGKDVKAVIVTGIDALGRSHEVARIQALVQDIAERFGPEAIPRYIHAGEYVTRVASGLDIDIKNLVKTPEEQAAEANQARATQLTESLGGPAIKAATDVRLAANQGTAP